MKRLAALAIVMLLASSACASPLRIDGKDYLDMNENYRTGMVHGMLLSFMDLAGTSTQWGEAVRAGYDCMAAHPRTVPAYTVEFSKYIESHPRLLQTDLAGAFLVFMVDCPENK